MPTSLLVPQVTRIPIAGPQPYNTLVCVATQSFTGFRVVSTDTLSRFSVALGTQFRLAGFDQRVAPKFDHSTTAVTAATGPAERGTFQFAVDSVTGAGFDSTGTYFVAVDVAVQPSQIPPDLCSPLGFCLVEWMVAVCSFVLVYEPPVPQLPQGVAGALPPYTTVGASAHPLATLFAQKLGVAVLLDEGRTANPPCPGNGCL